MASHNDIIYTYFPDRNLDPVHYHCHKLDSLIPYLTNPHYTPFSLEIYTEDCHLSLKVEDMNYESPIPEPYIDPDGYPADLAF